MHWRESRWTEDVPSLGSKACDSSLSPPRKSDTFIPSELLSILNRALPLQLSSSPGRQVKLAEQKSFVYAVPTEMSSLDHEDQIYQDDVKAVKQWWADSRWRYTKRPFTAEQIVAKRGNLKIQYPSNAMSKKLWNIVEGRFKVG